MIMGRAYQPLASIFQLATLPTARRRKSLLVEPRGMGGNLGTPARVHRDVILGKFLNVAREGVVR